MDNAFRAKVHAAAVAAWWTFLIAAAFITIQWIGYLLVMHAKPEWALSLWGPGATWEGIGPVWFHVLLIAKLSLWPLAVAALWLTLWARSLRVGPPNS
jgi:hypothetical protein